MSLDEKRGLVCPSYKKMSVYGQCKVIELPRSSYYFKPNSRFLYFRRLLNMGRGQTADFSILEDS